MLRALASASISEPERGAPLILRALWRESGQIPFAWRRVYKLPPTDPRYLEMDEEGMAEDLLLHSFYEFRHRSGDPSDPLMRELAATSRETRRAILELQKDHRRFDEQVQQVTAAAAPQPSKITKVTIVPDGG